jgi:hypothetical protein
MNNTAVKLEWSTMPEMTRYLYIAERSMDQLNWSTVGEILGGENAAGPNVYDLMDYVPESGMNYYRVRRLSPAGVESISEVRETMLNITLEESLVVYPNPTTQVLYVRNLMPYESDAHIQIFAANGALLYSLKISAGSIEFFEVPVADLMPGIYLARIRFGDGETKTVKVSKF